MVFMFCIVYAKSFSTHIWPYVCVGFFLFSRIYMLKVKNTETKQTSLSFALSFIHPSISISLSLSHTYTANQITKKQIDVRRSQQAPSVSICSIVNICIACGAHLPKIVFRLHIRTKIQNSIASLGS